MIKCHPSDLLRGIDVRREASGCRGVGDELDGLQQSLSAADPVTLEILSTPHGVGSSLKFSSRSHRMSFWQDKDRLMFQRDELSARPLARYLIAFTVAVERNRLPTLLTWKMRMRPSRGASETSFSGVAYLREPKE